MSNRNKVINGLEHCHNRSYCNDCCPYSPILNDPNLGIDECTCQLAKDALELVKEQDEMIRDLKKRLMLLEHGDQDAMQSGLMPAT